MCDYDDYFYDGQLDIITRTQSILTMMSRVMLIVTLMCMVLLSRMIMSCIMIFMDRMIVGVLCISG